MFRTLTCTLVLVFAAVLACAPPEASQITRLAAAARQGAATEIAALAAGGADVNGIDEGLNHWTPLLHAIHKGQRASVEALIKAGADVNRTGPSGISPLEMAAANGQAEIVRILLAAGANPREPGVFTAAVSGGALTDIEQPLLGRCNTEIVRALLTRSPDLRLPRNARGRLSLLFARLNNCREVIQLAAMN